MKKGSFAVIEANRQRSLFWIEEGRSRFVIDASTWPVTCSCPQGKKQQPCAHWRAAYRYCRLKKLPFGPPIRSEEEDEKLKALFGKRPWDRDPPSLMPYTNAGDTP
jgi:hypothetical protein